MFNPENLFKIMKSKGFNNKKLAEALNDLGITIKEDAFKAYKYYKSNPRMEVLSGIAYILDIAEQELFDTSERIAKRLVEKYDNSYKNAKAQNKIRKASTAFNQKTLEDSVLQIPIFLQGSFTDNIKNLVSDKNLYIEMDLIKNYYNYKNIIAINITGDSMGRRSTDKNIYLIELVQQDKYSKSEGLYLVRYGNVVQIKRVQFLGNDEVILLSLNPEYPPISPKEIGNDWEIIGKPFMRLNIEYYNNVEYLE